MFLAFWFLARGKTLRVRAFNSIWLDTMSDTLTPAGLDALTATATPPPAPRFGVYCRARGERWTLIVTCGNEALARKILVALIGTGNDRDWSVRREPGGAS